jgi:hypothetical protein
MNQGVQVGTVEKNCRSKIWRYCPFKNFEGPLKIQG